MLALHCSIVRTQRRGEMRSCRLIYYIELWFRRTLLVVLLIIFSMVGCLPIGHVSRSVVIILLAGRVLLPAFG